MDKHGPRQPLRAKVVKGLSWSMLQSWSTHVITLMVFLVTARLLGPEAVGSVALAFTIVGALLTLLDLGFCEAVVREKNANDSHYNAAFWTFAATSLFFFVALCVAAAPLAEYMRQPQLRWILVLVGLTLPVAALGLVPGLILRRAMDFKPIAQRALASTASGGVVGIVLAVMGYGYWALVVKGLVEAAVSTLLIWRFVSYRPKLSFDRAAWHGLFRIGRPLIFSRLAEQVNLRADSLIVSAYAGAAQLGLYSAAQRIYRTMMDAMFMAIQQVALPAFAQIIAERARTQQALLSLLRLTSFVTFPLFALLGVLADPSVPVAFGSRWAGAAPILSVLCAGGMLFSVSYYNGSLMTASGHTGYVLRLTILNTSLNLVAFFIGVQWGPVGVALGMVIRGYLVYPYNVWLLRKAIGISIRAYATALAPNFVATLVSAALTYAMLQAVLRWLPPGGALLVTAAGAVLIHFAVLVLLFPAVLVRFLNEAKALVGRIPALGRPLQWLLDLVRRIRPSH